MIAGLMDYPQWPRPNVMQNPGDLILHLLALAAAARADEVELRRRAEALEAAERVAWEPVLACIREDRDPASLPWLRTVAGHTIRDGERVYRVVHVGPEPVAKGRLVAVPVMRTWHYSGVRDACPDDGPDALVGVALFDAPPHSVTVVLAKGAVELPGVPS